MLDSCDVVCQSVEIQHFQASKTQADRPKLTSRVKGGTRTINSAKDGGSSSPLRIKFDAAALRIDCELQHPQRRSSSSGARFSP
jgi:hypothetical protein